MIQQITTIDPLAAIKGSLTLGKFVTIAKSTIEGINTIGAYTVINSNVRINNSKLGRTVVIGEGSKLNGVNIGDGVEIGPNNKIWPGCNIDFSVVTERHVTLHENVTIAPNVRIEEYSSIGTNCTFDTFTLVGSYSVLDKYVEFGSNVIAKNKTLILNHAKVKDYQMIEYGAVVIPCPTLRFLYLDCEPYKSISRIE